MIRLTIPSIDEEDIRAVNEVLRSGFLVQGAKVAEFEEKIRAYTGSKYAMATSNCTTSLYLSLKALGVGKGDYVIVSPYSWAASANVIELSGARSIFADIEEDSFNISPAKIEEILSDPDKAAKTKAIIPVHAFGSMADMPAIMKIADNYNIPVVEDAACALGATISGKQAGTFGKTGCFSFHPRKAITTGEGGIVVTEDIEIANKIKALRNHGIDPETPSEFIMPGYNFRMTEFQAAFGSSQMKKLDRIIKARQKAADNYKKLFAGTKIIAPSAKHEYGHVYQSFVVLLPQASNRQNIIVDMKENGVETTIGTVNIPMTKYYRDKYSFKPGDFPICDRLAERALTLPLYENISAEDQGKTAEILLKLLK